MRQLFINAVSSKAGGGLTDLSNTLPMLTSRLLKRGWKLRVFVVDAGAEVLHRQDYDESLVTVVAAESPFHRAVWELATFPRIVRNENPTAVFQFSNLIFRPLKPPQITVLRSPTFYSSEYAARRRTGVYLAMRYQIGRRFAVKTIQWADRVFCISQSHRDDILSTVGEEGRKVAVSYLGFASPANVDSLRAGSRSSLVDSLPKQLRNKLSPVVPGNRKIILNIAHNYEHKNLGDLLQAASILAKKDNKIALIMTAGLSTYSGPWSAKIREDVRRAKKLEEDGVLFDLGPVPKEAVWPLLALSDVFAFPSSLESFGHPLLEAMSMEAPLVAADTPIHREIAGDAAVFHRVGDHCDLASQLEDVLDGKGDVSHRLQLGKQRASQFTWERHVDLLVNAILEMAPQPNGKASSP